MTKPIRPEEVPSAQIDAIPDVVFEVFNELIVRGFSDGQAVVRQSDALEMLNDRGIRSKDAMNKGWLNVEDSYRRNGWAVKYEKPGYNETGSRIFTFKVKK